MPYLILFGNSWNQCGTDTAVIHLEGWVVPKEHYPLFLFTCREPPSPQVPHFHTKPQPPCWRMNVSHFPTITHSPIIWVISASKAVILKPEAL